jgi:hypothetical protein
MNGGTMSREDLDELLEVMPKIAEAVNSFEAADLQRDAFSALLRAYGVATAPSQEAMADVPELPVSGENEVDITKPANQTEEKDAKKARPSRKSTRRQWSAEKNIDFWPEGKPSLDALCQEKKPTSIDHKNLISVFWFEQIAEVDAIDPGKILAAYKAMGWAEPSQPDTQLRNTASRYHWIDTSDIRSIKTTPGGRNTVNQHMPIEKVKK